MAKAANRALKTVLVISAILVASGVFGAPLASAAPPGGGSPFSRFHLHFTLTSPNAQMNGSFGSSAAISGRFAIIGAIGESVGGRYFAGRAYVYNSSSESPMHILTSPNAQDAGGFGGAVAISGTLAVVGAFGESVGGHSNAGRVYLYNAATGKLVQTLESPNVQTNGNFGGSVAVNGRFAVIGGPGESVDGPSYAGHAYVYEVTADKLTLVQTLTSPSAQKYGHFGGSVAVSGGLVVVGAPNENASGYQGAGHTYLYIAASGKLVKTLTSPNAQDYGQFGNSVALGGKLAVVGALGETADGQIFAGRAYAYNASSGSLIQTLTSPNAQYNGVYGISVAISGKTAVIGAFQETADGYADAGHAYVYELAAGKLKLVQTLTSPNAQTHGFFGIVATSGESLVVGADGETAFDHANAGHAYVYG